MMPSADQQIDALIQRHEASWQLGYAAFPAVLKRLGLTRGAEIGVAFGGHSEAILKNTDVTTLYAIDSYQHRPEYDDPMNLSQPVFDRLFERTGQRLAPFGDRVIQIRRDSVDAAAQFEDNSLDFVYLDADHSEAGVWQDLCSWAIKVREGGIIAGHDYGHTDFPGVKRAADRFFARFGWHVQEAGHGVWWVERQHLPITFFTPCYNCAAWVTEAALSIIDTNLRPGDEYILVNDGSTDDTAKKLDEIAQSHHGVRVLTHNTNQGGSAARNTAVASAKNALLFCLDADNLLMPACVTPLRDHLIRSGTDTVGFQILKYFTDRGGTENITHELVYEPVITDFERTLKTTRVPAGSGNYLFTKEAWQRAGGYPEGAGALDAWGFGLRKSATGCTATVLPGSFYYHRHDINSYWVRHKNEGTIDRTALEVIRPFLHLIDPRDIRYLKSKHGRKRWFTELNRRPIRTRATGQTEPTKQATKRSGLMDLIRKIVVRTA